jgi:hypothetical protein
LVTVAPNPLGLDHLRDLERQIGVSWRRIIEIEQLFGEAIKVVDGPRPRHGGHRGGAKKPMRRDDKQRPWPRQVLSKCLPCLRKAVLLERVHWAAMADEQSGHPAHLRSPGNRLA